MEEALVKVFKCLMTSICLAEDEMLTPQEAIESFLRESELTLSEHSINQLVNHLEQLWN